MTNHPTKYESYRTNNLELHSKSEDSVAEVKTQPAALDQIRVSKLVEISVCALQRL
jgi:hypothetical protein